MPRVNFDLVASLFVDKFAISLFVMTLDPQSRKIFRLWSWAAFMLAVLLIASTGEGLLTFLARVDKFSPALYGWVDLFMTFVPFLIFVSLGLKTPSEELKDRINKLKQNLRISGFR
jgi:hypothetical protein